MEALYVCHFSDGHIKVGRSVDPLGRIASHAERVSCLGVELVASHQTQHVDQIVKREAALIAMCSGAASERHKNEWFLGLDFAKVCGWADECAYAELKQPEFPNTGIGRAVAMFGSCSKLAAAVDASRQNIEHWLSLGYVPAPKCAQVALATNITVEVLNPLHDWQEVRRALAIEAI